MAYLFRMRKNLKSRLLPVAVALGLFAATPALAQAAPHVAGTFDLTGQPRYITQGSDGNVWVTISGSSDNNTIARIKPNGSVKEYSPVAVVNPVGITTGPDGDLWLTRNGGVIRVKPNNPDNAQDFDIAAIGSPQAIVSGPQGKLWTASDDQLVSFKPNDPNASDADTINGMSARGITASGGKLWIADFGGQRIVRSTPSGDLKKYNVGGGPQEVGAGPNGGIAYANPGDDPQTVGRIGSSGGPKTTKAVGDPFGMDFTAGKWWISMFAKDQIGVLSQNGDFKRIGGLPNGSGPRQLTTGPGDTLWVSLEQGEKVARIKGVN